MTETYTADTQLALDGRNKRRALEERTRQGLEGLRHLGLTAGYTAVQASNAHILLTSTLLGLDQTSGAVDADNQTAGNFGLF